MNKKIIAIGIVALFLLTGFTAMSVGAVEQPKIVEEASEIVYKNPYAKIQLETVENLKIEGKLINGQQHQIYLGATITATERWGTFASFITSASPWVVIISTLLGIKPFYSWDNGAQINIKCNLLIIETQTENHLEATAFGLKVYN